eukprot:TRINITY_DN4722_c0_g3_i6.p4 TRINITY_DN4722_c0_g3~~TRINITY_DN4722_c0_g3_i6.p4  ORF type:complete len:230 (+),score=7.89 TRINITY_DN4722_c0_g3_i6:1030-1719(+)
MVYPKGKFVGNSIGFCQNRLRSQSRVVRNIIGLDFKFGVYFELSLGLYVRGGRLCLAWVIWLGVGVRFQCNQLQRKNDQILLNEVLPETTLSYSKKSCQIGKGQKYSKQKFTSQYIIQTKSIGILFSKSSINQGFFSNLQPLSQRWLGCTIFFILYVWINMVVQNGPLLFDLLVLQQHVLFMGMLGGRYRRSIFFSCFCFLFFFVGIFICFSRCLRQQVLLLNDDFETV